MKTLIIAIAFFLTLPAEAKVSRAPASATMDPDIGASAHVDFETRAVVQIKPAYDSLGRSCTATQIEDKIFLMAGHCVGFLNKSVTIANWSNPSMPFKIVEKFRQPPLAKEGEPDEEVDSGHDLGLILIQPHNCNALKPEQQHTLPISKSPDSAPVGRKAQLAAFGGSGFKFLYLAGDPKTAKFGPTEESDSLQTTNIEIFECKDQNASCNATAEMIKSFKGQSASALNTVAKRTLEITETPVSRQIITHREGSLFLTGDSGAALVQKDKEQAPIIAGVLSASGVGAIDQATVTVFQDGVAPIEIPIKDPETLWPDADKTSAEFKSVQDALQKRHLTGRPLEMSRSYRVTLANFFSSLSDPKNREFIDKDLQELRKLRDEKSGCGDRKTASKK